MFERDGHKIIIDNSEDISIAIGYTIEQYEAALEKRVATVRADLERAHAAEKKNLSNELVILQMQKANLEQSYSEMVVLLDKTRKELSRLSKELPHDDLQKALKDIENGELETTTTLLANAIFTLGENSEQVLKPVNNFAVEQEELKHFEKKELAYHQQIEIFSIKRAKDHPEFATDLNNLGVLYYSQERFSEAAPLLRRALVIREAKLPKGHPDTERTRQSLENLYAEHPQRVESMRSLLKSYTNGERCAPAR